MNWLAHIFISKNSIDYQLGNLLADPLKGRSWQGASRHLKDGFKMHRSIDAFTDSNTIVLRSKSRLGAHGYLKGVIIDIAYDYLLLKHWSHYSKVNIECFIDTFYRKANVAIEKYPGNAQAFVKSVIDSDLLISYGTLKGLEVTFQRIDSRLSGRVIAKETAVGYLPLLKREMPGLEQDFSQFFPLLVEHFKSKAGEPLKQHWLR